MVEKNMVDLNGEEMLKKVIFKKLKKNKIN